jgi:hypothetical protein
VELNAAGRRLIAALGFLQLPPRAPELRLLHRWLDTWNGIGLIAVGMHRQGLRLSLSHIADGEWRCVFMGDNPLLAPRGFGVAGGADGGVGGGASGCGRRVSMTVAEDLLHRHLETLVANNARWQTLIAEDVVWELPFAPALGHPARRSRRSAQRSRAAASSAFATLRGLRW